MTPSAIELPHSMPRPGGRPPRTAVAAAVATALGVLLAPEAMSQAATQADIQSLEKQVQKLQQEIDRMKTQPVPAPSAAQEPSHTVAEAAKAAAPVFYAGPLKVTLGAGTGCVFILSISCCSF